MSFLTFIWSTLEEYLQMINNLFKLYIVRSSDYYEMKLNLKFRTDYK